MNKNVISNFLNNRIFSRFLFNGQYSSGGQIYFVHVNPKKISHISLLPEGSSVLSGPGAEYGSFNGVFDLLKKPFNRHFMYHTVQQILNGNKWESTPYYKKLLKKKSGEEAIVHLEKLNRHIQLLTEEGYLSQYQLGRLDKSGPIGPWDVPTHEILIAMDRKGYLFRIKGGRHRLAVAQNIGITEMPAILTLYHKKVEHLLPDKRRVITGSPEDFRPF